MARKLPPVHPGELLLEEFLKPMGISQYRLAKEIGVSQRRIGQIVTGKRAWRRRPLPARRAWQVVDRRPRGWRQAELTRGAENSGLSLISGRE